MSSKVDAVCLALTALWQADPDLEGVQVVDGPQANSAPADEWLFVGFDGDAPDEANEGVVAEQDFMAFLKTKQETAKVTCAVIVVRGDTDIPAARARALDILSDAEDSLRADLTLGGLVMQAHVSSHQYMPAQTNDGAKVRLVFTVTYLAQLS